MGTALALEHKVNDVCKYAEFNLLKVKLVKFSLKPVFQF